MSQTVQNLQFKFQKEFPHISKAVVIVPDNYVDVLYQQASLAHKNNVHTHGFAKGSTPLEYVEQNYRASILTHVKEFLLKYFVISFLYQKLGQQKIVVAGEPRLYDIVLEPHHPAEFYFELSMGPEINLQAWKNLPFKSPKRKNYKDIDRQVESFIKEELAASKTSDPDVIAIGDWICFDICLIDENNVTPFGSHRENLWLHIGNEEADEVAIPAPHDLPKLGVPAGQTVYALIDASMERDDFTINSITLYDEHTDDYTLPIDLKSVNKQWLDKVYNIASDHFEKQWSEKLDPPDNDY